MTITLELELRSSKNERMIVFSKKQNRPMIIKKPIARIEENKLHTLLMLNKGKWDKMIEGKSFPLKVGFFIYRKTRRAWDWINLLQGTQDAMTKAGYIPDDNVNYLTPVFLGWAVDKENPRVEICVL